MSLENVDRLSMLPEEVLVQILSLIPTICAVRTSILSKRWRYSWMFVTNIDLDDKFYLISNLHKCIIYMDRILKLCKAPQLNLFRLRFFEFSPLESRVSNWIKKAVSLNVRELDLQVVGVLQLPLNLFTCKTLTILRLDCKACEYDVSRCQVNLPCLKNLDIVGYTYSFLYISRIISGSPVLESLSFQVTWYKDKKDYMFNIPTLKRLKVKWINGNSMNKVVLRVPNLEYLFVGGNLGSSFVMEDVSSLVEASLSIGEIRLNDLWVELLKGLSGVKSLSVENNLSTTGLLPNLPNMKHLELKSCWSSRQILQFLESCPRLEHLYIEELEDSDQIKQRPRKSSWIEPKLVPSCMLTNLTTIMFSKCKGTFIDKKFLEYMIVSAKVLKTVKVTWKNKFKNKEMRLCKNLIKVPKASSYCEVEFLRKPSL